LLSLWAARGNGAAKSRARNKTGARDGLHEKAEGDGKKTAEKTSGMIGRIRIREVFDRQRHRAHDRVHVLDLAFRTAEPPSGSWR